jgi:hypothetical protein
MDMQTGSIFSILLLLLETVKGLNLNEASLDIGGERGIEKFPHQSDFISRDHCICFTHGSSLI